MENSNNTDDILAIASKMVEADDHKALEGEQQDVVSSLPSRVGQPPVIESVIAGEEHANCPVTKAAPTKIREVRRSVSEATSSTIQMLETKTSSFSDISKKANAAVNQVGQVVADTQSAVEQRIEQSGVRKRVGSIGQSINSQVASALQALQSTVDSHGISAKVSDMGKKVEGVFSDANKHVVTATDPILESVSTAISTTAEVRLAVKVPQDVKTGDLVEVKTPDGSKTSFIVPPDVSSGDTLVLIL
eukprot:c1747_g1_i1.p1 GENE.c1747_g1_i1~~c1747_g1_i1.p1  ORF type:complete len:260 (+),score=78.94 c1747_g1_i1:42-782(+)